MFRRAFFGVVVATFGLSIAQADEPLSPTDEPAAIQTQGLPPAIGSLRPTVTVQLPERSRLFNGKTNVVARNVEQQSLNGSHVIRLTGHPSIEHTSERNGSFVILASHIQLTVPKHVPTDPDVNLLSEVSAYGVCEFSSGSIRVSADRIAGRTNPDDNRLSIAFEGNVFLVVGDLMLTADSATLTRTDTGWSLTETVARSAEGNVHYHRDCGSCGNTKLTSLR